MRLTFITISTMAPSPAQIGILMLLVAAVAAVPRTYIMTTPTTPRPVKVNNYGIPAPYVIQKTDTNYQSFKTVDDILRQWMNTSVDACDDFYQYACGKGQADELRSPFNQSETDNIDLQISQYRNDNYIETAPHPVKQLRYYFDKCVNTDATDREASKLIKRRVEALKKKSGVKFPLIYQKENVELLKPENFGKLIGFAISDVGMSTFAYVRVEQDPLEPDATPARIAVTPIPHIDHFTLNLTKMRKEERIESVIMNSKILAAAIGETLDEAKLQEDAAAIAELEERLYICDFVSRFAQKEKDGLRKLSHLQNTTTLFDFTKLIEAALSRANATHKITNELEIFVNVPDYFSFITDFLHEQIRYSKILTPSKLNSTLANYVHYFAAMEAIRHLPDIPDSKIFNSYSKEEIIYHLSEKHSPEEISCHYGLVWDKLMVPASNRVFADAAYPTQQSRFEVKTQISEMAKFIFNGFREQLNIADWMSEEVKRAAYAKLDAVQLNVAFPEWVTDDAKLIEYYEDLAFTNTSTTIEVYDAIYDFLLTKSFEDFLLEKPRNRADFVEPVGQANSAYLPWANTMLIYGGFIHSSRYDIRNTPKPFAFGTVGTLLGHELTHGFDSTGVDYDGKGATKDWLDAESKRNFDEMSKCTSQQYSHYCPIAGKLCLNGEKELGENIADNGGLKAAYNAYKAYEALKGPSPRLPSDVGSLFTGDQLFFLSYANLWCSKKPTAEYMERQIEKDKHALKEYRIKGTLQNFPAFKAAFNCPAGSEYAPKKHCNVWTSKPFFVNEEATAP